MINTLTNVPDLAGEFAQNNYFFIVNRPQTSLFQNGAPGGSGGASRTDTFVASAGPITSVYLSRKATVGTVYVSSINGTQCLSNGRNASGGDCLGISAAAPGGGYYFIDATNQVVFGSP